MPKRRGSRHQTNRLSARFVKTAPPGFYCDGHGLNLRVDPTGSRRWVQRLVIHGTPRTLGLGGFPLVSLKEARAKAFANRKLAREGGDPLSEKHKTRTMPTFKEAANFVLEQKRPGWRNPKHAKDWPASLQRYVFPRLGTRPIAEITTADVLSILTPIWHEKPETARRVRQRIGAVMKWAVAMESPSPTTRLATCSSEALGRQVGRKATHARAALCRGCWGDRGSGPLPGFDGDEARLRVPGPDGGAIGRGPPCDVARMRSGHGSVDDTRRTHEVQARTPGAFVRPHGGSFERSAGALRRHWLGVPERAGKAAVRRDTIEAHQGIGHCRRAAWVPFKLPGLGCGTNKRPSRGRRSRPSRTSTPTR